MDVDDAKRQTMEALGISDPEEVSYITRELLEEYQAQSTEVEKKAGATPEECKAAGASPLAGFGAYGNSLVFLSGRVDYKAGPRGSPNYGCGTDNWTWRVDRGDTFTPQGACSGGRQQYLLYCPTCV